MAIVVRALPRKPDPKFPPHEAEALENLLNAANAGRLVQLLPSASDAGHLLAVFQSE